MLVGERGRWHVGQSLLDLINTVVPLNRAAPSVLDGVDLGLLEVETRGRALLPQVALDPVDYPQGGELGEGVGPVTAPASGPTGPRAVESRYGHYQV